MLSLSFIREHPDLVRDGARKKGEAAPVDEILKLDAERRVTLAKVEQLKAEQNKRSAAMAKTRDQAGIDAMRGLKDEVKALEQKLAPIDARLNALLLEVPNLPDPSVPEGKDASANPTIRDWGLGREFSFTPKSHYDLGINLGLFDFERGVKVATSRFLFLKGAGARLERAESLLTGRSLVAQLDDVDAAGQRRIGEFRQVTALPAGVGAQVQPGLGQPEVRFLHTD